jgi:hypothetical protein
MKGTFTRLKSSLLATKKRFCVDIRDDMMTGPDYSEPEPADCTDFPSAYHNSLNLNYDSDSSHVEDCLRFQSDSDDEPEQDDINDVPINSKLSYWALLHLVLPTVHYETYLVFYSAIILTFHEIQGRYC